MFTTRLQPGGLQILANRLDGNRRAVDKVRFLRAAAERLYSKLPASCEQVEHCSSLYLKLNSAENSFLHSVGGGSDYLGALNGDKLTSTRCSGNYSHMSLLYVFFAQKRS